LARWWSAWLQWPAIDAAVTCLIVGHLTHSTASTLTGRILVAVTFLVDLLFVVPTIRAYRALRASRRLKQHEGKS